MTVTCNGYTLNPQTECQMNDNISQTIAAGMVGIHPNTLRDWRKQGKGPPYTTIDGSTAIQYSRAAVIKWMKEHGIPSRTEDASNG